MNHNRHVTQREDGDPKALQVPTVHVSFNLCTELRQIRAVGMPIDNLASME